MFDYYESKRHVSYSNSTAKYIRDVFGERTEESLFCCFGVFFFFYRCWFSLESLKEHTVFKSLIGRVTSYSERRKFAGAEMHLLK